MLDFILTHARIVTYGGSLQRHERGYVLPPRTVADYNFIFVTRGRVVWEVAGKPHELGPGDLILVAPGVGHRAYSLTRRITLGSLHVDMTLPGGRDVLDLLSPAAVRHVPRNSRLSAYFRGFMAEFDGQELCPRPEMLPGWARLIVFETLREAAGAPGGGARTAFAADPLVADVLDLLHRRVAQPVSLGELSRLTGFTPQHLNRVFRRALGVTPLRYLLHLRLEQAAALLRDDRLTIRAVAARVGFDDPYYFSRVFHQHAGRSPAAHRAAAGSDSPSPDSASPSRRRPPSA